MIDLTSEEIRYAKSFIALAGYNPSLAPVGLLQRIHALLSLKDEPEDGPKYNGHNWETSLGGLSTRRRALFPEIDLALREFATKEPEFKTHELIWPNEKRFAVCLTHDIDILHHQATKYILRILPTIHHAPRHQLPFMIARAIKFSFAHFLNQAQDLDLKSWIDLEASYGFKSTLNFMVNNIDRDWDDGFYHLRDVVEYGNERLPIHEIMADLHKNGWDVGIHGTSKTYKNSRLLLAQLKLVSQLVGFSPTSGRQHHLYFDKNLTPTVHLDAGLSIDSTIGSNIDCEYRVGTGLPFFYDSVSNSRLLQLPLVIQDIALARLKNNDEDLMVDYAVEMIEEVRDLGGCITILWHNNYSRDSFQFRVYERILDCVSRLNGWGCSMADLNKFWRDRARIILGNEYFT